ncbi:helix-turn-helix domain-containing protein [Chitinophaga pendula]|uniref:helix-turn-helix domain-containing protein n=1 Tax=Chitinophaga TaxID=79328 RepID=UPI000BAE758B|nr:MULTISPECIES: helix-turn-helix domain-containing protein [Chitinophaga]ASZ10521.1 AraC family transcriptional regulator [Chitinophaga sp. MD30]UCJ06505.1 helix-turn-helix domain-containing protein [Chitinophaga pendula]
MSLDKGIDIPYQQLPFSSTGQFHIFPLSSFISDLARLPHRHHHYQLIWFTQASGQHVVDFVSYELKDNLLFLLEPGQVHQLLDSTREGHSIVFSEKFYFSNKQERETLFDFSHLFDSSNGYMPIPLGKDAVAALEKLAELMYLERNNRYCNRGIIKHYLNAFLLLAEREKKQAVGNIEPGTGDERVWQLRRLVDQHFRTEHQAAFYADAFALTPKRLNEITRERTGRTVTELVHTRLVLEAKRNLAFSHKSIKEISYELGFEDPAYFSRFFKHHAGNSPQDFRDRMLK